MRPADKEDVAFVTGDKLPGDLQLTYYPDSEPGIRRHRHGKGFSYIGPDGTRISDKIERKRLASLAVPPAYEDVWISPREDGHLVATGVDARKRKQYRYHPDWTEFRSRQKYELLPAFGRALPRIRRRMTRDLRDAPGTEAHAIAAVVALIDRLGLRVGNPEYAEENGTFGATTLKPQHVRLSGGEIRVAFTAKGGLKIRQRLRDRRLERILHAIGDLPGRTLISWLGDDGEARAVGSHQVNAYLAGLAEVPGITAKTFRTWNGTLAAFSVARTEEKPTVKAMAEAAAARLHNTPTIARTSYIHPAVVALAGDASTAHDAVPVELSGLHGDEAVLLGFLEAAASAPG